MVLSTSSKRHGFSPSWPSLGLVRERGSGQGNSASNQYDLAARTWRWTISTNRGIDGGQPGYQFLISALTAPDEYDQSY